MKNSVLQRSARAAPFAIQRAIQQTAEKELLRQRRETHRRQAHPKTIPPARREHLLRWLKRFRDLGNQLYPRAVKHPKPAKHNAEHRG